VALVGESGAGKSSAAAALLRFRDISAGDYLIDGIDARCLRPTDVRRFVGLAGEDAHLLSATVRDNLSIADPSADDAVLIGMLEEVELGQWLASLPDGLETRIGPGGRPVSGGERRLLSLARGLLAGFPILIADEPTAGLDPETARRVVERILAADCGLLLITHTAEGLEAVDEIVVLADGRVAERGTHDELLAAGGLYARFWEARRAGPAGR
jgi:ATP-binding cassette subfamily C protein CydCD